LDTAIFRAIAPGSTAPNNPVIVVLEAHLVDFHAMVIATMTACLGLVIAMAYTTLLIVRAPKDALLAPTSAIAHTNLAFSAMHVRDLDIRPEL
jgi:hypothetical protein